MRAFVDGHNAIHALRITGADHAALRRELLRRVAEIDPEATVFFDAKNAPPDAPATAREGGLRVVYCRRREADEEMIERVRGSDVPGGILVVTNDREVRGRAAQLGGKACKVAEFFARKPRAGGKRGSGAGGFTPADFGLPDEIDLSDPDLEV